MDLTLRQVATIAANLGHRDLRVVPLTARAERGNWRAECSCGYRSTRRQTELIAAQAAAHHVETIVRAWYTAARASGRDVSPFLKVRAEGIPDTPTQPPDGMSGAAPRVGLAGSTLPAAR